MSGKQLPGVSNILTSIGLICAMGLIMFRDAPVWVRVLAVASLLGLIAIALLMRFHPGVQRDLRDEGQDGKESS